jgi:hypothetical protein
MNLDLHVMAKVRLVAVTEYKFIAVFLYNYTVKNHSKCAESNKIFKTAPSVNKELNNSVVKHLIDSTII